LISPNPRLSKSLWKALPAMSSTKPAAIGAGEIRIKQGEKSDESAD
jgi:hypothetical protein